MINSWIDMSNSPRTNRGIFLLAYVWSRDLQPPQKVSPVVCGRVRTRRMVLFFGTLTFFALKTGNKRETRTERLARPLNPYPRLLLPLIPPLHNQLGHL